MRGIPKVRPRLGALFLALFVFFMLLPLAWWVVMAFSSDAALQEGRSLREVWVPSDLAFGDNLRDGLSLYPINTFFLNSMVICVIATVGDLLLSACAGFALSKHSFRGRGLIFAAVVGFLLIPQIVLVVPWLEMMAQANLVNTRASMIIPVIVSPIGIFMMTQFINEIPDSYLEAARIDGASEWWIFVHVVLPLTKTGLITLATFTFILQWDSLLWPLIATSREDLYTFTLGISLMQTNVQVPYNALFAVALAFTAPIIALFIVVQRRLMEGLGAGGLKE